MSSAQVSKIPFPCTVTCKNLCQALHTERQNRQFYLSAAETYDGNQLHVVAHAMLFTAAQEKEHADIFEGLLSALGGEVPEDVPLRDLPCADNPAALLDALVRAKRETGEDRYPAFAEDARTEGFLRVATAFRRIAETERLHAKRFRQFRQALDEEHLFRDEHRVGWRCLPCGHLHYGLEAPALCSACGCSQDHFIRSDFHPFQVRGE